MIFRLSQKLGDKVGIKPTACYPLDPNPFADWSGHVFRADRTEYVLLTNTASLYSAVMYGRGITDDSHFLERALSAIREFMESDGLGFLYLRLIASSTSSVTFSKALNRSVAGSMNDLIFHAKFWLVEREASPYDASFRLNELPMSVFEYRNPREVMKLLPLEAVQTDAGGVQAGD